MEEVGEQTKPLMSQESQKAEPQVVGSNDQIKKPGIFQRLQSIGRGGLAAVVGVTGASAVTGSALEHFDPSLPSQIEKVVSAPLEIVGNALPGTSSEFTTPKEVLAGRIDIRTDGGLRARKEPNMSGDVVDWNKIKILTNKMGADGKYIPLPPSSEGFSIQNPLIVDAQNPNGGATHGKWPKILVEDEEGKQFSIYVSQSEQTAGQVSVEGNFVEISSQELDGKMAYKAKNPGDALPNGAFNDVIPLVAPETPTQP